MGPSPLERSEERRKNRARIGLTKLKKSMPYFGPDRLESGKMYTLFQTNQCNWEFDCVLIKLLLSLLLLLLLLSLLLLLLLLLLSLLLLLLSLLLLLLLLLNQGKCIAHFRPNRPENQLEKFSINMLVP